MIYMILKIIIIKINKFILKIKLLDYSLIKNSISQTIYSSSKAVEF